MKKLFLLLSFLFYVFSFSQVQTFNTQVKLNNVPDGITSNPVMVRAADGIVKKIPFTSLISAFAPTMQQVRDAGNTITVSEGVPVFSVNDETDATIFFPGGITTNDLAGNEATFSSAYIRISNDDGKNAELTRDGINLKTLVGGGEANIKADNVETNINLQLPSQSGTFALDSNTWNLTGDQTSTGIKTFSNGLETGIKKLDDGSGDGSGDGGRFFIGNFNGVPYDTFYFTSKDYDTNLFGRTNIYANAEEGFAVSRVSSDGLNANGINLNTGGFTINSNSIVDAGGGDLKQNNVSSLFAPSKNENRYTVQDVSSSILEFDFLHLTDVGGTTYFYNNDNTQDVFSIGNYSYNGSPYSVSIGDKNDNANSTSLHVNDGGKDILIRANEGINLSKPATGGSVRIRLDDLTTAREHQQPDRNGKYALDNEVIRTVTATTNLISDDKHIDISSGTFTIPFNVSATSSTVYGKEFVVTNSGSGIVTLDPNGSETINSKTTYVVPAESQLSFRSNGSNWVITNRSKLENFNRTQWSQNISTTTVNDATALNLLTLIPNGSKVANGTDGGINELNIASNSILVPWRGTPMTHQIRLTGTLTTGTAQNYNITLRRTADNSIISSYQVNRNADVGLFTMDFVTYTGSSSDPFVTGGFYLSFDNNSGASVDLTTNLNLFVTTNFK